MPERLRPPARPHRTAALAAVMVVALAVAACSSSPVGGDDDGERSARVGESFVASLSSEIEGFPSTIVVPGRRYDLVVTSPREAIDTITAGDVGVDPDAAEGTRFVAVTWQGGAAGGDAVVLGGAGPDVSPRLSLVVDGEPIEVGALDEEGVAARWVVVPGDARQIGVAVEFDGVTQTVEDVSDRLDQPEGGPGLLDDLDPPGLHSPECPEPPAADDEARYAFSSCHVTISDPFPYHRDLGWAGPDRAWVVASVQVQPVVVGWDEPGTGGAVVAYETSPEDVEVTLDDAGPVDIVPAEPEDPAGLQEDGSWAGEAVFEVAFDVAAFDVAFRRPYTGLPEDADEARTEGTPAELTGTYEASFPIAVG